MEKKLFYKSNNNKKKNVVIFLHGLHSSSLSFVNLLQTLEDKINYIAIDLPTHGKSFKMQLSIEGIGEEIISFIKEKGLSEVSIVGHSLGGAVGAYVASKIDIKNLVLIDPYNPFILEIASVASLAKVIAPKSEASLIKIFEKMIPNNSLAPQFAKYTWAHMKNNAKNFAYLLNKQLLSEKYALELKKIFLKIKAKNITLINMEKDIVVPLKSTIKTFELLKGSEMHVIKDLGHSPQHSHPDKVKEIILEILNK